MASAHLNPTRARPQARGVVLLALLIALALLGIGLMAAADVWSVSRQREREQELLFAGEQYRQAIQHYYLAAPAGTGRILPASLEVLLDDDRFPIPQHHLRRAYRDPVTGNAEWGEVRVNDRIIGVFSLSEGHPLKQANFPLAYQQFTDATSYRDWIFQYRLPRSARAVAPAASDPVRSRTPSNPSQPIRRSPP